MVTLKREGDDIMISWLDAEPDKSSRANKENRVDFKKQNLIRIFTKIESENLFPEFKTIAHSQTLNPVSPVTEMFTLITTRKYF